MSELAKILREEIVALFTLHKRGTAMLFFIPLLYTLLFGGLFAKNAVNEVPVAVSDLDGSAESRSLIRAFDDADALSILLVGSTEETKAAFRRGKVAAYVVIPQDFSERLLSASPVSVEAVVNNANTVLGSTAMNGVQAVVGTLSAERAAANRMSRGIPSEAAAAMAAPVQLSLRSLYNSTGGYNDFYTSVLIVHALQIAAVFTVAPMASIERRYRRRNVPAFLRLPICAFLLSVLLTASMLLSVLVGVSLFDMACRAALAPLSFLIFCFAFAMTAFALAVGAWVKSPTATISYTLFYIMPSVLFTGAAWPRFSMDAFSRLLSWVMPIGYAAIDLRELLVRGGAPTYGNDCATLFCVGCLFLTVSVLGHIKKEMSCHDRHLGAGTFDSLD